MIDSSDQYARTVSEVAHESGVAASAIRFYEKHGIIGGVRTSGNQRRFDDSAACRVKVARVAQRIGFSIADIARLLNTLPRRPQPEDWERIHHILVAEAEQRIADINTQLTALESDGRLCELADTRTSPEVGRRSLPVTAIIADVGAPGRA